MSMLLACITFAERCGSCTMGFQLISAWMDKNNKTLFFLHGGNSVSLLAPLT
jgi:hypothetical protein